MDGGERIPGVAFVACAYTTSVPGTHIAWLFKKRKLFIFHVLVYLYIQLSVHFSFKLIWEKRVPQCVLMKLQVPTIIIIFDGIAPTNYGTCNMVLWSPI